MDEAGAEGRQKVGENVAGDVLERKMDCGGWHCEAVER
jgi:hypothetical protein